MNDNRAVRFCRRYIWVTSHGPPAAEPQIVMALGSAPYGRQTWFSAVLRWQELNPKDLDGVTCQRNTVLHDTPVAWVWVELRFDSRVACERHKALSTVLNCQEMESLTVRGAQQSVWFSGVWSQDWGGDLVVWNLVLYISACISIKMLTHTYIHMHTGTPPSPSPIPPPHIHTDYCQLNSTFHLSGESPSEKLLWTLKRWARGQAIRRLFCGLL